MTFLVINVHWSCLGFFSFFGGGKLSGSLSQGNLLEDNIKNIHGNAFRNVLVATLYSNNMLFITKQGPII